MRWKTEWGKKTINFILSFFYSLLLADNDFVHESDYHLKFFIFLSKTTPYQNNFCEKILRFEPKTIFLEFFKNVQICLHLGTPFVLVFFRGMKYFKEHVTLSTGKH